MADIDPTADPDRPARCPRRLREDGPRCLTLVLVRDADEHEAWHDDLEQLLTAPVDMPDGVEVAPWPPRQERATAGSIFDGPNL